MWCVCNFLYCLAAIAKPYCDQFIRGYVRGVIVAKSFSVECSCCTGALFCIVWWLVRSYRGLHEPLIAKVVHLEVLKYLEAVLIRSNILGIIPEESRRSCDIQNLYDIVEVSLLHRCIKSDSRFFDVLLNCYLPLVEICYSIVLISMNKSILG